MNGRDSQNKSFFWKTLDTHHVALHHYFHLLQSSQFHNYFVNHYLLVLFKKKKFPNSLKKKNIKKILVYKYMENKKTILNSSYVYIKLLWITHVKENKKIYLYISLPLIVKSLLAYFSAIPSCWHAAITIFTCGFVKKQVEKKSIQWKQWIYVRLTCIKRVSNETVNIYM